jgi:3-hydroxy-9,10-secoandrosta-1,3,5(10)-triene-9,17-dione monooxygenase reductase component
LVNSLCVEASLAAALRRFGGGMTFDSARFRHVLGHFPTGVTIVTGLGDDGPTGFTIGSFTSVSLDPPLVGFLPMLGSSTWSAIARSGCFCVNILSDGHGDLCWQFARPGSDDHFNKLEWRGAPTGSPIIDGAVAWIDCTIEAVHPMGDHHFVLGRVVDLAEDVNDPEPLLFYRGQLGRFLAAAQSEI